MSIKTSLICAILSLVAICKCEDISEAHKAIVEGNAKFALPIYYSEKVFGDMVFSPFIFYATYALFYLGAKGKTAELMAKALHLPNNPAFVKKGLTEVLSSRRKRNDGTSSYTKVFIDEDVVITNEFKANVIEMFGADIHSVNNKTHNTSGNTSGDWYKNIVYDAKALSRVTIAHKTTFHGKWLHAFKPEYTTVREFPAKSHSLTIPDSSISFSNAKPNKPKPTTIVIPPMHASMMNLEAPFKLLNNSDIGAYVLELPFNHGDNHFGFVIILPHGLHDFNSVRDKLKMSNLTKIMTDLSNVSPRPINVFIPKFNCEHKMSLIDGAFIGGLSDEIQRSATDFSGIFENAAHKNFRWNMFHIQHIAKVQLTEEGVTAEEKDATVVVSRSLVEPPVSTTEQFAVDHKFIYIIRCLRTGNILFMGWTERTVVK